MHRYSDTNSHRSTVRSTKSALLLALAAAIGGFGVCTAFTSRCAADVNDQYVSTGDNLYQGNWLPLESHAAIDATFQMFKDVFNTRRIYWRGMEDQIQIDGVDRPENVLANNFFNYAKSIDNGPNGLNNYAVQEAHSLGMQIWGQTSMYDFGSSANTGTGAFPAQDENPIRTNNPQWIPVDKFGVRTQGGALEFGYPAARQAAVNLIVNGINSAGYDGVLFHTYTENYGERFLNEFGFSDPVVNDYKALYSVDIRKQSFNEQDLANLRGTYTTDFLSELHTALAPSGKQIGVGISPLNQTTPMYWLGNQDFPTAGNITQDWKTWAQNGSVSTLVVWGGGDGPTAVHTLASGTQGTGVALSGMTSSPYSTVWNPSKAAGDITTVGESEDWQYFMASDIPIQPISSLTSTDQYKRGRTLAQIIAGGTTATVSQILPLVNDSNILNRRMALQVLGMLGGSTAISTLENALNDPDSSVRDEAIYGLGQSASSTTSYNAIMNAINAHGEFTFTEGAYQTLIEHPEWVAQMAQTVKTSTNPVVRGVAMRSLATLGNKAGPIQYATEIAAVQDSDPTVRAFAVDALGQATNSPGALQALVTAMLSNDTIISSRAATAISTAMQRGDSAINAQRSTLLGDLSKAFEALGDGSTRTDEDWAYYPIGNALAALGSDGTTILQNFMNQRTDRQLSLLAWQVLYLPQSATAPVEVTESQQDEYDHFKMPRWDKLTVASDNLDNFANGTTINGQSPQVGFQWVSTATDPADQIVQSQYNNGGKALKLVRRLGGFQSLKLTGYSRDEQAAELTVMTASADWMHLQSNASTTFSLDMGASTNSPTVYIDPASHYRVWESDGTAQGGQYIDTGYLAGTSGWETIDIVLAFNLANNSMLGSTYDVYLTRGLGDSLGAMSRTLIAQNITAATIPEMTALSLVISNQSNGVSDITTYWDNISLTQNGVFPTAVPEPAMGTLLGVSILSLCRRGLRSPRRVTSAA